MKKFVAILLATMFILSSSVAAFAESYPEEGSASYECQYCGATFENAASLADHVNATIAAPDHAGKCGNHCDKDFDGEEEVCPFETKFEAELAKHKANCEYEDNLPNWDKAVGYFKAGNIAEGFKYLGKAIIDFVKSDTFKGIVDKVVGFVKGIDFGGIIGTIKGVIEKIPFAEIIAKVKTIVG